MKEQREAGLTVEGKRKEQLHKKTNAQTSEQQSNCMCQIPITRWCQLRLMLKLCNKIRCLEPLSEE